ncbi:MAG: RNA methyltransferase [Bacteroidetes bacterium]|nr:RNA methyltransferase [Bacteroidota bacterium]
MITKSVVKDIQSLTGKKYRDQAGLFLAEGSKLVEELLRDRPHAIKKIFALENWIEHNKIIDPAIQLTRVTTAELKRLSQLITPHEVVAVVAKFPQIPLRQGNGLTVVCCGIQDPGNFGTILRTADWFGVNQIVCSPDTVDVYNPKVVQATMGSIARLAVHFLEIEPWLKKQQLPIYAAVLDGKPLYEIARSRQGILLIGNEAKGVPASLLTTNNITGVTIPKVGGAESLNVAVATGILLSWFS